MTPRLKLSLFRVVLLLIVIVALEATGYIGMWASSRPIDFLANNNYFRIRDMLMGNKDAAHLPKYLTLPYLGYIPYPAYRSHDAEQHNTDGYRGRRIPLEKGNKLRILCLGGSTTYGNGVKLASETFPAVLEEMLDKYIGSAALNEQYKGVEVINAGLEAGNSADELAQYLFKYRYYKPDVVVVHSGVNDAELSTDIGTGDFQLDYSHSRRINFHHETLKQPARFLMKSYFFSFLAIRFFFNDFTDVDGHEFVHLNRQTYVKWSDVDIEGRLNKKDYSYYPFYQNSNKLFDAVKKDSAILILLPNALNPKYVSSERYSYYCALNAALTKDLAEQYSAQFIPFTFELIDATLWIDDCHLNAAGEKKKAALVYEELVKQFVGQDFNR